MRENKIKIIKKISFYVGLVLLFLSTLFIYLGIEDYIRAALRNDTPRLLACSIIGIVLVAIGIFLLIFSSVSTPTVSIKETVLINSTDLNSSEEPKKSDEQCPKICQVCSAVNDYDSNFCKKCGNRL